MVEPIITIENLSKRYRIGAKEHGDKTFREVITDAFSAPIRNLNRLKKLTRFNDSETSRSNSNSISRARRPAGDDIIWALKDVSFEVKQGEILGIIGRNGAGKSTLLKILSRITEPTTGDVKIYGRISSLLEVGTGFHPELTGRENIFLNGAILGMRKQEIKRKFDEIVAFAETEKFIDTPVKHYSSGMYVRLAFAVAAHLEPEILLVDEVLAVGDVAFQKKCLGKMSSVAEEGRTVLFVSHNMAAMQSLCGRALWLDKGKVVKDGSPGQVVTSYLTTSFSAMTEQVWENIERAPGNDKVRLHRVCVRPKNGSPEDPITVQTPIVFEFEFWNLRPSVCLNLSLLLINREGINVLNTFPVNEPVWNGRPFPKGLFRSVCYIPGDLLNDGTYRLLLFVVKDQGIVIYRHEDILVFDVIDVERQVKWYGKWDGVVRPTLEWKTELLKAC